MHKTEMHKHSLIKTYWRCILLTDISMKPSTFTASLPSNMNGIYQDSDIPMTFATAMVFDGANLAGRSTLLVSFEFFLSDKADITPETLNSQSPLKIADVTKTQLSDATKQALSGDLVDKAEYVVSGMTEVHVSSDACAESSRYMCVRYKMLLETTPPFRDVDSSNDFQCTDISSLLKCTNGKNYLVFYRISFPGPQPTVLLLSSQTFSAHCPQKISAF